MSATGYITIDKNRLTRRDSIVAILKQQKKTAKSLVVTEKGDFYSSTTPKKIAERFERGEKTKNKD